MLYAPIPGGIEVRQDGGDVILSGRFPYGAETELMRGRFEVFASGALHPSDDVHLLAGHDYNRPLASRRSQSLTLSEEAGALSFEARLSPEVANTSHGRDTLAMVRAGLSVGLSPGFRVSPDGASVERRANGVLRTVRNAELFELSIVTRPAYSSAQVEARSWITDRFKPLPVPSRYRWR